MMIKGELTRMKRYYLAYGSNLCLEQMKKRCPKHKVVGMMLLEGYELLFRKYLTVRKNADSVVPVGIFEVDKSEEKILDRYEDCPYIYRKEEFDMSINGEATNVFIYITNENVRPIELPPEDYFKRCLKGYEDFGFDTKYLYEALERSGG